MPPDEEGKVIQCAGCGKKIRLPVSPSPAAPPPPAPAKPAEEGAGEFDWGQEFQLEGSSDEPAQPAPETPRLPPMAEDASSLGFESEEFRIDDAELGGAGGAGEKWAGALSAPVAARCCLWRALVAQLNLLRLGSL